MNKARRVTLESRMKKASKAQFKKKTEMTKNAIAFCEHLKTNSVSKPLVRQMMSCVRHHLPRKVSTSILMKYQHVLCAYERDEEPTQKTAHPLISHSQHDYLRIVRIEKEQLKGFEKSASKTYVPYFLRALEFYELAHDREFVNFVNRARLFGPTETDLSVIDSWAMYETESSDVRTLARACLGLRTTRLISHIGGIKLPFQHLFDFEISDLKIRAINAKDAVAEFISSCFDSLSHIFGSATSKISELFSTLSARITGMFSTYFKHLKIAFWCVLSGYIIWLAVSIIFGMSFLKERLVMNTLKTSLSRVFDSASDYVDAKTGELFKDAVESHADPTPVGALTAILIAVFGLSAFGADDLTKKARQLSTILAGSLLGVTFATKLFMLLPPLIYETLSVKFDTPIERQRKRLQEWMDTCMALNRLSTVPHMLSSPTYKDAVYNCLNSFKEVSKSKDLLTPAIFGQFINLTKTSTTLKQFELNGAQRVTPFAVHLFGAPGVCKSLISAKLIRDITAIPNSEIYNKPNGSEFWDGFRNQQAIIMDEFFVGPTELKTKEAATWLPLISSNQFLPPMASVDNASVGVKGTTTDRTRMVLTMNNEHAIHCPGFDVAALNRRYNYKIHMSLTPLGQRLTTDNSLDIGALSKEQMRNTAWAKYTLVNKITGKPVAKPVDYEQLVVLLKKQYQEHIELGATLLTDQGFKTDADPSALIEDTLREIRGIPTEGISWIEYISQQFVDSIPTFLADFITPHAGRKRNRRKEVRVDQKGWEGTVSNTTEPSEAEYIEPFNDILTADPDSVAREVTLTEDGEVHVIDYVAHSENAKRHLQSLLLQINVEEDQATKEEMEAEYSHSLVEAINNGYVSVSEEQYNLCTLREDQFDELPDLGDLINAMKTEEGMAAIAAVNELVEKYQETKDLPIPRLEVRMDPVAPGYNVWKIVAISSMLMIAIGMIRNLFGADEPMEVTYQSGDSPSAPRDIPKNRRAKQELRFQNDEFQMCDVWVGETRVTGILVDNTTLVTVNHIFKFCENPKEVDYTIIYQGETYHMHHSAGMAIAKENSDVRIQKLSSKVIGARSKTSQFCPEGYTRNFDGGSVIFHRDDEMFNTYVQYKPKVTPIYKGFTHTVVDVLVGDYPGRPGDCGMPLTTTTSNQYGKIIAIHAAGSPKIGVGAIVTREYIEQAIEMLNRPKNERQKVVGPNVAAYAEPMLSEVVFAPDRSKYKKNLLSPHITEPCQTETPLLSASDPRNPGGVPSFKVLNDYAQNTSVIEDQTIFRKAASLVAARYEQNLNWNGVKRCLTIDEAVLGIPGVTTGLDRDTSAGFPLCKKGYINKTKLIPLDERNNPYVSEEFRQHISIAEQKMFSGEPSDARYIVHMKDEPMSSKKVKEGRTRLIFCGSAADNVVIRTRYGATFAAINNSPLAGGACLGINPYSRDLDCLKRDMESKLGYDVDGWHAEDIAKMDQTIPRELLELSWGVIHQLSSGFVPLEQHVAIVAHELDSWLQLNDCMVRMKAMQPSGCVGTAHINSIAMEIADTAWALSKYPEQHPFTIQSTKHLGDDVIRCTAVGFDMPTSSKADFYKSFGMTVTSDVKDAPLDTEPRPFECVTFLGVRPFKTVHSEWVGVPVEKTINKMLHWTTNDNATLAQSIDLLLSSCSNDPQLYSRVWLLIKNAADKAGARAMFDLSLPREDRAIIQAARCTIKEQNQITFHSGPSTMEMKPQSATGTASTMEARPGMLRSIRQDHMTDRRPDEGQEKTNPLLRARSDRPGLTSFMNMNDTHESSERAHPDVHTMATSVAPMSLDYGTESAVVRQSVLWPATATAGTILWSSEAPFDLLKLGNQNNLQNMPFERHVFWRGNVSVTLTINAIRFSNGMAILGWVPLGKATDIPSMANWSMCKKVYIQPNRNSTVTLTIPYYYFRAYLNTIDGLDNLGTFFIGVYSPLITDSCSAINFQVSTSFPSSTFLVPRPIDVKAPTIRNHLTTMGVNSLADEGEQELESHGFTMKRADIERGRSEPQEEYKAPSIWSVLTNPFGAMTDAANRLIANPLVDHDSVKMLETVQTLGNITNTAGEIFKGLAGEALGMDNPHVQTVQPIANQFPGMSKVVGPEPTTDMQLRPNTAARNEMAQYDASQDNIAQICAKECLLTRFDWVACDNNPELLTVNLTSACDVAYGNDVPLNVAIINQFTFWRANPVLVFRPIRNSFQNGRLVLTVAYQSPSLEGQDNTPYYNHIMDFSEDNYEVEIEIPWNCETEFLRTQENRTAAEFDPIENYSLASVKVGSFNGLVIAEGSVKDTVEVLVFIRFKDLVVAEPRGMTEFHWEDSSEHGFGIRAIPPILVPPTEETPEEDELTSHAGDSDAGTPPEHENTQDDPDSSVSTRTTEAHYKIPTLERPTKLEIGKKFEYYPKTFSELARRYEPVFLKATPIGDKSFPVAPHNRWLYLFRAWSGSIRFNMFFSSPTKITWSPNYEPRGHEYPDYNHYQVDNDMPVTLTNYYYMPSGLATNIGGMPIELAHPLPDGRYWIRATIPFKQHLSFLKTTSPNVRTGQNQFPCVSGRLYYSNESSFPTELYISSGDDFRYHIFLPPKTVTRFKFPKNYFGGGIKH